VPSTSRPAFRFSDITDCADQAVQCGAAWPQDSVEDIGLEQMRRTMTGQTLHPNGGSLSRLTPKTHTAGDDGRRPCSGPRLFLPFLFVFPASTPAAGRFGATGHAVFATALAIRSLITALLLITVTFLVSHFASSSTVVTPAKNCNSHASECTNLATPRVGRRRWHRSC
jgi:hypothetical protein